MKLQDCLAVILIIGIVILLMLVGSCAWKNSASLDCRTETNIKRICDGKGTGRELIILPKTTRAIDE